MAGLLLLEGRPETLPKPDGGGRLTVNGHVRQRSEGSWSIVIYLGRGSDGKKKYKWETVHGTKKQAEARKTQLLHELNTGGYVEPAKMTLGEFLDRWVEDYAKAAVRPSTLTLYKSIIAKQIKPRLGHIPLARLTGLDVQRYYTWALSSGRVVAEGEKAQPLSPASVRKHHNLLHKALGHAVQWGLVARNVAEAASPPSVERPDIHPLTAEEVLRFLGCVPADRYALYLTAVTTGLRRGEVLGLRWQDLDLGVGTISVRRSLGAKAGIGNTKTRSSVRQVVLSPMLIEALKTHRARQAEERLKCGPHYRDHGLVFTVAGGDPIGPRNLVRQFKAILKKAKLPQTVRFHDLRHTHATLLLKKGVHMKVVSERLGHSSVSITGDIYAHVLPSMQQEAAGKADLAIFGEKRQKLRLVRGLAKD